MMWQVRYSCDIFSTYATRECLATNLAVVAMYINVYLDETDISY